MITVHPDRGIIIKSNLASGNREIMFHAPGVTDADIGGKPFSQYPFMLKMSPGRDDVIIMLVGETEKQAILSASKDLLSDLCFYRNYLCTNSATRTQMPNN